jgi:hypothetical protein
VEPKKASRMPRRFATATVGVGQPGEDVRTAARPNIGGVGVEHALVVRLAILRERLNDVRVRLVAVGLQGAEHHAEAAVGHDRPLERRFGLKPDDDLVVLIDVAGGVCRDRTGYLRDVEYALLAFLNEQFVQSSPDVLGAGRCKGEERLVAVVGFVVLLNEASNVDLFFARARA